MKKEKKSKNSIYKHKIAFFILNSFHWPDVTCSKLYRYGENIGDKKLFVEHTLNKVGNS